MQWQTVGHCLYWVRGPEHQPLKVLGQVSLMQSYIIKGTNLDPCTKYTLSWRYLEQNLLGLPIIQPLDYLGCKIRREADGMGEMTEAEARYGQNEKGTLASTWACERFSKDILTDTIGTVII